MAKIRTTDLYYCYHCRGHLKRELFSDKRFAQSRKMCLTCEEKRRTALLEIARNKT